MLKRYILPVSIILAMMVFGCAKRNTAWQEDDVLTLVRQIPVVGDPLDISFDADYIYVALDQGGISIINRSTYDFRWMTELSASDYSTVPLYKIRKIAAVGEYSRLFLNETDATDKIQIVNTNDADTLKVIDSITGATQDIQDMIFRPIVNPTDENVIELIYSAGRNVHYGRYNGDLWLGSSFSIYPPASASGIDLTTDHVFVAAEQRGLLIYNRSDQTQIGELAVYGEALKVHVVGSYAYIASKQGGLNTIDISNPAHPENTSNYDTSGYATTIDVEGSLAVVSSGAGGVYLFDLTVPSQPVLKQRLSDIGYTNNAKFCNGKLIVATRDQGVLVYDVSGSTP